MEKEYRLTRSITEELTKWSELASEAKVNFSMFLLDAGHRQATV